MSLTVPRGLKRLGAPLAAVIGIAVAGLFIVSWLLNRDALRQGVEAQLRTVTGLDLVVNGPVDISVFPGSYVSFHDVRLKEGGNGAPALNVDVLTANLRLLPLLMQRFEIADVMMLRPHIQVARDASGQSNWTPFIATIVNAMQPGANNPVSFSEIRIQDGVLAYTDDKTHAVENLDDIDLSLAWPSISRSFAATGQFDWRGQRVDASISVNDFAAALSGSRSGLKIRIAGQPAKFVFDGAMANRTSLMLDGTLTADSPSLRNAMQWAGQAPPGTGGFGRFAMKARANLVGSSIALTNVNIELDGNAAEGVMTLNNNGRQTIQATLAAGALDFTPYITTVRTVAGNPREWNRQLFDLGVLSATDLDMRLSAAKVAIGATQLGRTALSANLRGGSLALSVAEVQIYGGIGRGTFGISRSDAVADIKAQFQLQDVDLQPAATELFGINKLSGHGNINVAIEASGSSPFGLAQSLDGSATLNGHDGAINGFNIEQLLKRLERRPLSGGGNFRTGQTPFSALNVALRFNEGIATAEDVRIDGPSARVSLTGTASVPAREYDLKGVASLASNGADASFDLPFVVQGPWDDPLIFPDPESLIRRSPASAPLLDAVKDRKTRDAVKSVLDRLTGAKPAQPDALASPPPAAPVPSPQKQN